MLCNSGHDLENGLVKITYGSKDEDKNRMFI